MRAKDQTAKACRIWVYKRPLSPERERKSRSQSIPTPRKHSLLLPGTRSNELTYGYISDTDVNLHLYVCLDRPEVRRSIGPKPLICFLACRFANWLEVDANLPPCHAHTDRSISPLAVEDRTRLVLARLSSSSAQIERDLCCVRR
jgi:hypothetical protein